MLHSFLHIYNKYALNYKDSEKLRYTEIFSYFMDSLKFILLNALIKSILHIGY